MILPSLGPAVRSAARATAVRARPVNVRSGIVAREVELFLGVSEDVYPGIDAWWRRRALPDIVRGARFCDGVYADGRLVGLCIGKLTAGVAKLCTLRIEDSHRGRGLAPSLLARFVEAASTRGARRIHFTMGQACELDFGGYFRALGFSKVAWEKDLYRRGHEEHVFAAPTLDVRRSLANRLGE